MTHVLSPLPLPDGVLSRTIATATGLDMHVLEAGRGDSRPLILLLHGFPELAYSWRKILPALAQAGYWAVAPDQRGYGRTTGWTAGYEDDLAPFHMLALVRDVMALVSALGRETVACVVGHDFGSPVAAWCALSRPDIFRSVVLMSAPFTGAPAVGAGRMDTNPDPALSALPRPRKHYQWYYSTREAESDMLDCPQGLHDCLRAYYHVKSADWPSNTPCPLKDWSAGELARMPTYYIMDRDVGMAQTVAPHMPSPGEIAACRWLTDADLAVYVAEFSRTGLQGGLQWYRCRTAKGQADELELFAGKTIDVPSLFIGGANDWGVQQSPGALDRMRSSACTDMRGCHLVENAGHWVQQEQPAETNHHLVKFLQQIV